MPESVIITDNNVHIAAAKSRVIIRPQNEQEQVEKKRLLRRVGSANARSKREETKRAIVVDSVLNLAAALSLRITDHEEDPLNLTAQLAGVSVLHSLNFPANEQALQSLSEAIRGPHRVTVLPGLELQAGFILAAQIAESQTQLFAQGTEVAAVESKTRTGLNAIRGAVLPGSSTLRDLLVELTTEAPININSLKTLFEYTRMALETGWRECYNRVPPDVGQQFSLCTQSALNSVTDIVKLAQDAHLDEKGLDREATRERSLSLRKIMAMMTVEFREQQKLHDPDHKLGDIIDKNLAILLVETIFSRRIQWVDADKTVAYLCQELIKAGWEGIAAELILQSKISGLVDHPELTTSYYQEVGFNAKDASELARNHRERIHHFRNQWRFVKDPFTLSEKTRFWHIFQGTFALSHMGQRAIVFADMLSRLVQNGFHHPLADPGLTYLISVNRSKPAAEGIATLLTAAQIPRTRGRIDMALVNFAGLPVRLTSLDSLTGHAGPKGNQIWVGERIAQLNSDAQQARICGIDRASLTGPGLPYVAIAMRSNEFRNHVENPGLVADLARLGSNVYMMILTDVAVLSATAVRKALESSRNEQLSLARREYYEDLYLSSIHPGNDILIKSVV